MVFADVGWDPVGAVGPRRARPARALRRVPAERRRGDELHPYGQSPEQALDRLADLVPLVVVSNGADGALAIDAAHRRARRRTGVSRSTAADTTGAGDVFAAGFIAATLWELPLERAGAVRRPRRGAVGHPARRRRRRAPLGGPGRPGRPHHPEDHHLHSARSAPTIRKVEPMELSRRTLLAGASRPCSAAPSSAARPGWTPGRRRRRTPPPTLALWCWPGGLGKSVLDDTDRALPRPEDQVLRDRRRLQAEADHHLQRRHGHPRHHRHQGRGHRLAAAAGRPVRRPEDGRRGLDPRRLPGLEGQAGHHAGRQADRPPDRHRPDRAVLPRGRLRRGRPAERPGQGGRAAEDLGRLLRRRGRAEARPTRRRCSSGTPPTCTTWSSARAPSGTSTRTTSSSATRTTSARPGTPRSRR